MTMQTLEDELYITNLTPLETTELSNPEEFHDLERHWPALPGSNERQSSGQENGTNAEISSESNGNTQEKGISPEAQAEIDRSLALQLSMESNSFITNQNTLVDRDTV